MTRRSRRSGRITAALCFAATVLTLGFAINAPSGGATDANPADTQFDQARAAVHDYEFRGTVRIWWHDHDTDRQATVGVVAADGGLRIDGGRVLADRGRAWLRAGKGWTTLWSDPHDVGAPSVAKKYTVVRRSGPTIVDRPTRLLDIRRDHRTVERIAFDRDTGLVLGRDRFDVSGAPTMRMQFVALTGLHPRQGALDTPAVTPNAPGTRAAVPDDAVKTLDGGFLLVDARRVDDNSTQLRYSDGVFEASVFTEDAPLDWGALPVGGRDVHVGDVRVRQYQSAAGTVLTWQAADHTFTCVTDATTVDQAGIVTALSRAHDSAWTQVVRFVTVPFSWS